MKNMIVNWFGYFLALFNLLGLYAPLWRSTTSDGSMSIVIYGITLPIALVTSILGLVLRKHITFQRSFFSTLLALELILCLTFIGLVMAGPTAFNSVMDALLKGMIKAHLTAPEH